MQQQDDRDGLQVRERPERMERRPRYIGPSWIAIEHPVRWNQAPKIGARSKTSPCMLSTGRAVRNW
jgi:hypothetical protein